VRDSRAALQQAVAGRQSSPRTGTLPARPAGKPGDFFIVKGEFATIPSRSCKNTEAPQYAFFKAWRNLSGPMWSPHKNQNQRQNQTPGRGRAASRWSAPSPGSRTCREEHAPSHRPQMSSGRLILDRVARQQSPSPLHRHPQISTHPAGDRRKGDISTLPGGRHFYFALTLDVGWIDLLIPLR
jgi:hypothetical protein